MNQPVATLSVGDLELSTTDVTACRQLLRLIATAAGADELEALLGPDPWSHAERAAS